MWAQQSQRLLLADPGVVRRRSTTCLPVPPEVEAKLRAHESLDRLKNIKGERRSVAWIVRGAALTVRVPARTGEGMTSYCVRCCVWRRPGAQQNAGLSSYARCAHRLTDLCPCNVAGCAPAA